LEGYKSPVLNLTSKPPGLALRVQNRDEQSTAMGWVSINHTACNKQNCWLRTTKFRSSFASR